MSGALDALRWIGGGRVAVSVPAVDAADALAVWEAGEGAALPSLAAAGFESEAALVDEASRCLAGVPALSIALGGGADVSQWRKVLAAGRLGGLHLNQPFTTAAFVKGRCGDAWVNGVVEPTEAVGLVRPTSPSGELPEMAGDVAAAILADGQVDALKLHPTDADRGFRSTVAAAAAAAEAGLGAFEPAGGLDLESAPALVERLVEIPRLRLLPHVFGAVMDRSTGRADPARVRQLVASLRAALG